MFLEQSMVIAGLWLAANFLPKTGLMSDTTHPKLRLIKKFAVEKRFFLQIKLTTQPKLQKNNFLSQITNRNHGRTYWAHRH
jgi:hypothetical protein